ncbi:MAG TPA: GNAT family N-acetyltransferase [Patescibacteria group bacterium]|nr:GNAT family N-acetyltransferase [Patescibacteria group bacterium]
MPFTIREEAPDLNLATLITSEGFVQPVSEHLREDVREHLAHGERLYSIHAHGQVAGFAIFNIWDSVLYLSGIMLKTEFQGRGIAERVVERVHTAVQAPYFALRTQSLRMWCAGRRMVEEWYPHPEYSEIPDEFRTLGYAVARRLGNDFPVSRGCYGSALYGLKPTCANSALQEWWDQICDFERGDAIVCVGRF